MTRSIALAAAALLICTSPGRAQLIAYDGFNYTAGQSLDTQNGGSGFARAWSLISGTAQLQAGNLAPPAPSSRLILTGNSVSTTPIGAVGVEDVSRTLSNPITGTPGTSVWVSVIMLGAGISGSTAQGSLNVSDGFGTGFSITTGTTGGGISPNNPPASSTWSLGDAGTGAAEAKSTVSNTLQSLLVASVTFGAVNDTVALFVNPALTGSPPGTASATVTVPHADSLSQVDLTYGGFNAGTSTFFDELRIGNTFADVTPTTPVPEPSSLLLAAIAGAGLIVRRNRKT